jgi:hypothetical protein
VRQSRVDEGSPIITNAKKVKSKMERTRGDIMIDEDFKSGLGDCKFHCFPTCHPAQIGPDAIYGCLHKAWPANRNGDFVPIVNCGGHKDHCDLLMAGRLLSRYRGGLTRRIKTMECKLNVLKEEMQQVRELKGDKNDNRCS